MRIEEGAKGKATGRALSIPIRQPHPSSLNHQAGEAAPGGSATAFSGQRSIARSTAGVLRSFLSRGASQFGKAQSLPPKNS